VKHLVALASLLLLAIPQLAFSEAADPPEKWTIMYYMCGDSTLEGVLIGDLNELEMVGSSSDVNILVQLDRAKDQDGSNGDWTDARRFRVDRDTSTDGVIRSTELKNLDEVDMTDPDILKDFLEWGIAEYDSDHFMLIVGGHGKGPSVGLCTDFGSSKAMSAKDFGKAFRSAGQRFDVVSMDMCWMGTAEIAAELSGYADYFIGSMDEIPSTGWPYDDCLPLVIDDDRPLEDRLSSVVDEFMDSYDVDGSHHYATLCVVDLDAFQGSFLPAWSDLTNDLFYSAYDGRAVYPGIISSADHTKNDDTIIDVFELSSLIAGSTDVPQTVRERARSVLALKDQVLVSYATGTYHQEGSSAFGVFYGKADYWSNYESLVLSEATAWDEFILMLESGIDARPSRLNWTSTPPSKFSFSLKTGSSAVLGVIVEAGDGVIFANHTCAVSFGTYSYTMDRAGRTFLFYRYKVRTDEGTITFPPDGFSEVRYDHESIGPSLLHWPPAILDPSEDSLTAYVWDDTGIDLGKSSLSYRAKGGTKYFSASLEVSDHDMFTGILTTGSRVEAIETGSVIEYYFALKDLSGNEARYPPSGNYETVVGQGKHFYIDLRHSSGDGYDTLVSMLNASFIIGEHGEGALTTDLLSSYDGYILIEPIYPFTSSEIEALSSFHSDGGEMLLVIDPGSSAQMSVGAALLDLAHLGAGKDYAGGMLSSDPSTILGGSLPTISVPAGGTFEAMSGSKSVYLAPGIGTLLSTSVQGKGRSFTAVPDMFSDDNMGRSGNRALLSKVLSTLSANLLPTLKVSQTPPGVVEPGRTVVFDLSGSSDPDGDLVSYSILIDGSYSESAEPHFEHVFSSSGLYTIVFTATDSDGASVTKQISAIANGPPTSDVGVSDLTIHSGDLVIFNYKGSDPDGDQITIQWDFGDGNKAGSMTAYHTYRDRGKYNVTMTAKDTYGLMGVWKDTVTVLNSDPTAVIDRDQIMVNEMDPVWTGPQKVTLQAFEGDLLFVSSDGSNDPDMGDDLNISWRIGEETIYDSVLLYTLKEGGLMTITLRVDDGFGGADETNLTVYILNEDPVAAFTLKEKGSTIRFSASAIDDPWDLSGMEYRWDFGDGSRLTTADAEAEHRYTFGGRYTVNLTVADPDGGEGYYETTIESGGITAAQALLLALVLIGGIAAIGTGIYFYLNGKMVREDKGLVDMVPTRGQRPPVNRPAYRSFSSIDQGSMDRGLARKRVIREK
jgi:PKD repeat protein